MKIMKMISLFLRQPIVMTCSLDILQDPERLAEFNKMLTQAIQAATKDRWRRCPLVYVMISGIEAVPELTAYFQPLNLEQKKQILGFTLPLHQADLKTEFKLLHQQLSIRVLSHLQWEATKYKENADVLFFPHALAETYPKLENALKNCAYLRGVYFTTPGSMAYIERDVLDKDAHYFKPWKVILDYAETQRKKIAVIALTGLLMILSIWWLGVLKAEDYLSAVSQSLPVNSLPALANLNQLGNQDDDWFGRYLGIFFPGKVKEAIQNQYDLALRKQFQAPDSNVYSSDVSQGAAIQSALIAVRDGVSHSPDPLDLAIRILNGQWAPLNQLEALAEAAPQPAQNILKSKVQAATRLVFAEAEKEVVNHWQRQVAGACRQTIQPPNPNLDHFSQFFSRHGLGGNFMNAHVSALVNIKNGQVEQRSAYGVPFVLPDFLQQDIVRLRLIHDAFFNQSNTPSLSIHLTPMVLSKNLADFTINYGTQSLFYQNGPRFMTIWNWPMSNSDVFVKFVGLNGEVLTESFSGTWALIQFLNSATVTTIDQSHFALTFNKGDYSASYELSLTKGNFAGVLALQGFDCQ